MIESVTYCRYKMPPMPISKRNMKPISKKRLKNCRYGIVLFPNVNQCVSAYGSNLCQVVVLNFCLYCVFSIIHQHSMIVLWHFCLYVRHTEQLDQLLIKQSLLYGSLRILVIPAPKISVKFQLCRHQQRHKMHMGMENCFIFLPVDVQLLRLTD